MTTFNDIGWNLISHDKAAKGVVAYDSLLKQTNMKKLLSEKRKKVMIQVTTFNDMWLQFNITWQKQQKE